MHPCQIHVHMHTKAIWRKERTSEEEEKKQLHNDLESKFLTFEDFLGHQNQYRDTSGNNARDDGEAVFHYNVVHWIKSGQYAKCELQQLTQHQSHLADDSLLVASWCDFRSSSPCKQSLVGNEK